MFLGDLLRITIANKIVLFDDDRTIGSFTMETVPEEYKSWCVMEIIIPSNTKWFSNNGTMYISLKCGNF